MAYENMTYEVILDQMMERITSNYPDIDTREGSIIFNALAPAAMELAIAYTELDNILNESFAETASREYLIMHCEQMGLDTSQFDANAGVFQAEFDVEVPIESRWNCDLYNFTVTELLRQDTETQYYIYAVQCETDGTAPNNVRGSLSAISDLPSGLTHAELTDCLIEGEDEASDDDVREAYYEFVNSTIADGNVSQYKRWCDEYDGIGNSKIFPLWNGANTVKVSILSASNQTASDELITKFQEYLDPNIEGMGNGVAPIGSFVTVTTATEIPINVSATITLKDGYTDTSAITTRLSDYLSEIAYEKSMVAYMNIGAEILNVDGVESIDNLTINGGTVNIELGDEEIPVIGTTDWVVSS